jgi:type IV pilus assembly protein PilV
MRRSRQTGMTLIEILISLLILAIGLLGMAGAADGQPAQYPKRLSAHAGRHSEYRYCGTCAGESAGCGGGSYDNAAGAVTAACNSVSGCTAAQMAANDVAEWKRHWPPHCPWGAGTVCADATPDDGTPLAPACDGAGDVFAVKIWWDSDRDGTAENLFTMSFQP